MNVKKQYSELSCLSGEGYLRKKELSYFGMHIIQATVMERKLANEAYIGDKMAHPEEQKDISLKLNSPNKDTATDLEKIEEKLISKVLKPNHYQGLNSNQNKRRTN